MQRIRDYSSPHLILTQSIVPFMKLSNKGKWINDCREHQDNQQLGVEVELHIFLFDGEKKGGKILVLFGIRPEIKSNWKQNKMHWLLQLRLFYLW